MANSTDIPNDDTRRRKLDELFADEPYLSATMKARRLHEKMNDHGGNGGLGEIPTKAYVESPPRPALSREPRRPQEQGEPMVSLQMARSYLRDGGGSADLDSDLSERLRAFKTGELAQWMKEVTFGAGR